MRQLVGIIEFSLGLTGGREERIEWPVFEGDEELDGRLVKWMEHMAAGRVDGMVFEKV